MSNRGEMWNAVKDLNKFISACQFVVDDDNRIGEPRKWFLDVNHKAGIIKIQPQGGKEDITKRFSKFAYLNNENPVYNEIAGARTSSSLVYGPFNDIISAYGYASLIKLFYKKGTGKELSVKTGNSQEIVLPNGIEL